MRYLKSFILFAAAFFAASCAEDPIEQPEQPKEPEAPVIVSAQLKGLAGEAEIIAGKPVKFTAEVTVKNSELETYTLEIKKDGSIIASASGELSGTEAKIEKELELNISAAALTQPFYPEVTIKVTNKDEMFTEKTLDEADNVKVTTMELLDALWLVDNLNFAYQMSATDQKGKYRTTADLSVIGTSFQIVSKVTEDGAIDPSGEIYGTFDTPDAGEHGLYWIGYDIFSGEMSKCTNQTFVLDYTKMAPASSHKVFWSQVLEQDCRVVFLNYPDGMKLQSDRWSDIEGNSARYCGHSGAEFEVFYLPATNWLVLKEQYDNRPVVWVTGEGAALPMEPVSDDYLLNWFHDVNFAAAYTTASLMQRSENRWEVLLYLKSNFGIKLYDYFSWNNELEWKSATPETIVISPVEADPETGKIEGNYGNAGPAFTEGYYMLKYNTLTAEVSLEPYTGQILPGVVTGNGDPIKPEPEPDQPEPDQPDPDAAPLYLVDNNNNVWEMSVLEGTHLRTNELTSGIGTSFRFAEKYKDGAIDETGKVYGPFDLDPAFALYGQKPHQVGFDTASEKVIYKELIDKDRLAATDDGRLVRWVVTLPTDCEVEFINFDRPVSELVNTVGFEDIDDSAKKARYIGVSQNYELWYRPDLQWLDFSNNIADDKMFYIGKNCSFAQEPYIEYPCTEDLLKMTGNTLSLFKMSADVFKINVYLADDFGFYLYKDYAWAQCVNAWASATPDVLVSHNTEYTFGTQNVEQPFTPGVYTLEYNRKENSIGLTLVKAMGDQPQPDLPPTALTLTDNNGKTWNMTVFSGSHFVTEEGCGEIGTSFTIKGDNGKDYGEFQLDAAYAVHGKKPWKVGFDIESGKVIYREGIWKSGLGDMGDGTLVQWVQCLPQGCELYFFGFEKPIKDFVNTGLFENIDEVNCCARYIGISDNYELRYWIDKGWLNFGNYISSASNKHTIIGKNASFPQSPYTEFPIVETGIYAGQNGEVCKSLSLYQISADEYRTHIYLADNYGMHIYSDFNWGSYVTGWTSLSGDVLVAKADGGLYYGVQNIEKVFTPGVYQLDFNKTNNTVALTLIKPDGNVEPEPELPPTALTLTDNNGKSWNMTVFNGSHFVTEEGCGEIGASFTIKGDNGKDYGEFQLDAAYAVHGKKPWKVGFDIESGKVIYREGIWKSGLGDMGDGTLVQWVQCLPQGCELYFFGFEKPIKDFVNTGLFENIDEVNCCARYIGISDNYELRYWIDKGWLNFGNYISSASNKHTIIGKNASFPQSPYTEFPIVETGIYAGQNGEVCKSLSLYQISADEYRTHIYLADNYGMHIYSDFNWGSYVTGWTSLSGDVLVAKADGGLYYGVQNIEKVFTPGVYQIDFNKKNNTVTLTKVNE